MKPLRIAIVVPGRFHAFDLGRALLDLGHDVTMFTNYPARVVTRFGFPAERVRSCLAHGLSSRAAETIASRTGISFPEATLHRAFGRWAARALTADGPWDVVHVWSGVAEEVLQTTLPGRPLTVLMRGSAHIRVQDRLLREEEARVGVPIGRPSAWMIAREQREYALADRIQVLSNFARDSFLKEGTPPEKLSVNPITASLAAFRLSPEAAKCATGGSGQGGGSRCSTSEHCWHERGFTI